MYQATKEQLAAFDKDHEYLKTKLDLGKEILWLTKEDCMKVGPNTEETLELVRQALVAHGKDEYEMPAKIGIHPYDDVFFHAMPAYVPGNLACGVKWIECFPRNPKEYDLPQTTGLQIMNDIVTGVPIAVMDCTWLTAMRTPAVTALAAAALHPDAKTFGMFGCGVQGIGHVRYAPITITVNMTRIKYEAYKIELDDWFYGDTENTPQPVMNHEKNSAPKTTDGPLYAVRGSADDAFSYDVPKDAGKYTVKMKLAVGDARLGEWYTKDFEITPRPVTIENVKAVDRTYEKGNKKVELNFDNASIQGDAYNDYANGKVDINSDNAVGEVDGDGGYGENQTVIIGKVALSGTAEKIIHSRNRQLPWISKRQPSVI